jgi:hypothetical protein
MVVMFQRLELLSKNLITIVNKVIYNDSGNDVFDKQLIAKLINDNSLTPFNSTPLTKTEAKDLFMKKIFPHSARRIISEVGNEIRIYFPEIELDDGEVIEDTVILFDIIVHTSLYLMKDEDSQTIVRPLFIAQQIIDVLSNKADKDTVGKLHFNRIVEVEANEGFICYRIVAKMLTVGK